MCLAVPGKVIEVEDRDDTRMAKVDFGGVVKDVCLAYLPDIGVGDYTIVHVGFAIQKLDEASALETLALFESLGIMDEEFGDQWCRAAAEAGEQRPDGTEAVAAPVREGTS
jgi:hydrogenase expression/formation protein HypC